MELHEAIKEIVDKSYFNDGLEFNYGYDNIDAELLRNKVFSFSSKGIKEFLSYIFYWNDVNDSWYRSYIGVRIHYFVYIFLS